jgi:hypothetical protein
LRDFVKSIGTPPLSMPLKDMLLAQGRKGIPCCIAARMWKNVSLQTSILLKMRDIFAHSLFVKNG